MQDETEVLWEKSYTLDWSIGLSDEEKFELANAVFGIERENYWGTWEQQSLWLVVDGERTERVDESDARAIRMAISMLARNGAAPTKDIEIEKGSVESTTFEHEPYTWWPGEELIHEKSFWGSSWFSLKVRTYTGPGVDPMEANTFKESDVNMTKFYQGLYKFFRKNHDTDASRIESDCKMTQITKEVVACPPGLHNGGVVAE